jgi:hypothetical protein
LGRHVFLVLTAAALTLTACTSPLDKNGEGNRPAACEGKAKHTSPTGYWKISMYDAGAGLTKTLNLSIGNSFTDVGIACSKGSLQIETNKVVESDFDDEFFSLERTGVLEIKQNGMVCRLDDIGGVYELDFGGDCLVLKNTKGTIYLETDRSN